MCKHLVDIIEELLITSYSQTYLTVLVSEQEFGHSRVVNGFVLGVSVPWPFLNDTHIFLYISYDVCKHMVDISE